MNLARWLKLVASLFVTAVIFAWLWGKLDFAKLSDILRNIDPLWFIVASVLLILLQWFRSQRLAYLLSTTQSITQATSQSTASSTAAFTAAPAEHLNASHSQRLFPIVCTQAVLNKFLPAWASEAALIMLLKKFILLDLPRATASVIVVRLFDLFIVAVAAIVGLLFAPQEFSSLTRWSVFILAAGIIGVLLLITIVCRYLANNQLTAHNSSTQVNLKQKLIKFSQRLINETNQLLLNPRLATILLMSLLIWITIIFRFTTILWCLQHSVDVLTVIWINLLVSPVRLLPIKGIANLGTHEAAWIFALTMTGTGFDNAALYATGSHAIMFLTTGVLFVFTLLWIMIRRESLTKKSSG